MVLTLSRSPPPRPLARMQSTAIPTSSQSVPATPMATDPDVAVAAATAAAVVGLPGPPRPRKGANCDALLAASSTAASAAPFSVAAPSGEMRVEIGEPGLCDDDSTPAHSYAIENANTQDGNDTNGATTEEQPRQDVDPATRRPVKRRCASSRRASASTATGQPTGQPKAEHPLPSDQSTDGPGDEPVYGNFDITFVIPPALPSSKCHPTPPHTRRVTCSTKCPRLSGADRCVQSDVMPDSRLQGGDQVLGPRRGTSQLVRLATRGPDSGDRRSDRGHGCHQPNDQGHGCQGKH